MPVYEEREKPRDGGGVAYDVTSDMRAYWRVVPRCVSWGILIASGA